MDTMYTVQNDRRAIRSFDTWYEAAGYLTVYVQCTGDRCVMYGRGDEISLVAERESLGVVVVRTFGRIEDARDYMLAHKRPVTEAATFDCGGCGGTHTEPGCD